MTQYIKKPLPIEACQVIQGIDVDIPDWLEEALINNFISLADHGLDIIPHEGNPNGGKVIWGDYIIKGEIYSCKADIFEASYDVVSENLSDDFLHLNGEPVELTQVTEFVDNVNLSKIDIKLQSAPVSEVGIDGLQIDDVIVVIKDILQSFQNAYPCAETSNAILHLRNAKDQCDLRRENRIKRGVEGTSQT